MLRGEQPSKALFCGERALDLDKTRASLWELQQTFIKAETGWWLNVIFPGQQGPQTNTLMSQYLWTFWDRNSNTLQFLLIILWTLQSLNLFYTTHPMVLAMSWVGVQPWLFSTAKEQHFVAVVKQKYSTVILSFACIIVLRCLHVIIFGQ